LTTLPSVLQTQGYLVAFIDLLGIANDLLKFDGIDGTPSSQADRATMAWASIALFRRHFDLYYKGVEEGYAEWPADKLPPSKHEVWNRRLPPKPIVQSFSDCVTVHVPLDGSRPSSFYSAFHTLLCACGGAALVSLGTGRAVRGAVAIGRGAPLSEHEVVGSGLVKAYKMESGEAVVPRVLVHPELLAYAEHELSRPQDWNPDELVIARSTMDCCWNILRRDQDGYVFIDYLGGEVWGLLADDRREIYQGICKSVAAGLAAGDITTESGRKLQAKWNWLAAYWQQSPAHAELAAKTKEEA
jgi:hypothetical protein